MEQIGNEACEQIIGIRRMNEWTKLHEVLQ
jgi:hypothetical protein